MMKIGPAMHGRIVVCPQCNHRLTVPSESDPRAEELYRYLKQKRAEEKRGLEKPPVLAAATVATATTGTSAPMPATQPESFEELEPDEVDRWIEEFWTTVPDRDKNEIAPHPLRHAESDDSAANAVVFGDGKFSATVFRLALIVVFVLGLFCGLLSFYIFANFRTNSVSVSTVEKDSIQLRGELFYRNAEGELRPDADAVVFVLPKDRIPTLPISSQGLRPDDNSAPTEVDGVVQIEELGGVFCRCGADGSFSISVSEEGRYLIFQISAHAQRRSEDFESLVLQEMRRFFQNPSELVGEFRFHKDEYELRPGTTMIRHIFQP